MPVYLDPKCEVMACPSRRDTFHHISRDKNFVKRRGSRRKNISCSTVNLFVARHGLAGLGLARRGKAGDSPRQPSGNWWLLSFPRKDFDWLAYSIRLQRLNTKTLLKYCHSRQITYLLYPDGSFRFRQFALDNWLANRTIKSL
jgi:hypothetical protein